MELVSSPTVKSGQRMMKKRVLNTILGVKKEVRR
jgi:hypothetical protein